MAENKEYIAKADADGNITISEEVVASIAGIPNIAVEGIMIFGAFMGVLFIRIMQETGDPPCRICRI